MHYALVLLALGGLLTLHELGHLVAARLLGVRVPRFVFGFGPPLVSFRLWGTQYVVAAVPLGATAHLHGMNPHRADADEAAGFAARGPLLRILIILAGPLANYALALGVLFALYTSGTHVVVPLTVGTVQPGSEAARAQLLPGDRIVMVAGQPLRSWSEFVEKVGAAPGVPLELGVERGGDARSVMVRPRPDERGTGRIGVSQQYVYKAHGAGEALSHSFTHTVKVAAEGVAMLKRMMQHGLESADAASPGALVRQESADAMSSGTDALLRTLVAASVVLALLTLLPVPGLDGGRVVLLLVEAASGRRIPPRVETVAQTVGFLGIAVAVVLMATAEIRRALPARFGMEESPAQDAGTAEAAQPPPAASDSAKGAVPSPASVAPAKGGGTTGANPAGTAAAGTSTGSGPAGMTATGTGPGGTTATSGGPDAGPAGKTVPGTGASATTGTNTPSGTSPAGTSSTAGGVDAGTQAATGAAPRAAAAETNASGAATRGASAGREATSGAVSATPPEAEAGGSSALPGATPGAAPSTGQTSSGAPTTVGSPTAPSSAAESPTVTPPP
ncbi:site-2 protease family protein [Myxococcus xanthus]|uniref:site-2 protease family protein n=1 Tax=Myxococcus xanthus TaxID=34 RepID=UPI001EFF8AF2|nr:site-2 protease family protein [Myxococcus xanthus]